MSLRTRLIIAFLILSVVPLSAVTLIWYISSVRTFERAAEREASETASDIGRRLGHVIDGMSIGVGVSAVCRLELEPVD